MHKEGEKRLALFYFFNMINYRNKAPEYTTQKNIQDVSSCLKKKIWITIKFSTHYIFFFYFF